MLGIPNYQPSFLDDPYRFLEIHKHQFEKVMGKSISRFWVMWEEKEDAWMQDGPVILEIGGDQFEFCAYQLDLFSLTLNSIDRKAGLDWYGSGEEMPLTWRENGIKEMVGSLHHPISGVNILTYQFIGKDEATGEKVATGHMLSGIELELAMPGGQTGYFSINNGLDQNELSAERREEEGQMGRVSMIGK